jgi:DNA-binding NtrC family response regulator
VWRVAEADRCETAFRLLSSRPVAAIVTNDRLPDGDWVRILGHVQAQMRPPNLIVASFHADDRLWAAVLNLGGYDVLSKPFDAGEVRWVVSRVCPPPAKGHVATRAA